jgi:hypothetical protein
MALSIPGLTLVQPAALASRIPLESLLSAELVNAAQPVTARLFSIAMLLAERSLDAVLTPSTVRHEESGHGSLLAIRIC